MVDYVSEVFESIRSAFGSVFGCSGLRLTGCAINFFQYSPQASSSVRSRPAEAWENLLKDYGHQLAGKDVYLIRSANYDGLSLIHI